MKPTYVEAAPSFRDTVLTLLLAIPITAMAVVASLAFTVWVPYTLFTGSLLEGGGWRVLIFLYVGATFWVNRKVGEPDFFETNPFVLWWTNKGWFMGFLLLALWEVMMALVALLPAIADPHYLRESIAWWWNLLP